MMMIGHLFPVLFTFVLICCLAIFLLHTFLFTLVFICAAFPPEPQLRTFLLPVRPVPSLYKFPVRGVFEDINMRWWGVMERSWCHDWVTSPCFLQWQFLSLVVRRMWGMSAPAASHTPVINNININPQPARPHADDKIVIRTNSSQIIFFSFWQNSSNLTQWTKHFSHLWSR